jgi:mRNA-degrading endonuclease toxin of MazEF toxin-antitoxin module
MVDYGMNIWTEINWIRPSIIFKSSNAKYGEDVIVIPITSCEWVDYKSIDQFDIELEADENNNLSHKSLIKVRQLRCISKKRLKKKKWSDRLNIFWEIVDNDLKEKINFNVKIMLWI